MKIVPSIARLAKINLLRPRHSWVHPERHVYYCAWCELKYVNTEALGVWFKIWEWPDNEGQQYQGAPGETPPACTGPRRQRRALLTQVEVGNIRVHRGLDGSHLFYVDGREPYPVTEQIGRAVRDDLVRQVPVDNLVQPELTDRGATWLRIAAECANLTAAA